MQKLFRAMHKKEDGFTLVELMVVVVIIGILVAIAIPIFNTVQTNAANRAHEANARTLISAAQMAIMEEGEPDAAVTWTGIGDTGTTNPDYDAGDFLEDWPTIPDSADTNPEFMENTFADTHNDYKVVINDDATIEVSSID